MAGGIDQTLANSLLDALCPNSGAGSFPTITGPIKVRVMTANGSDTAAGTELGTSGGYTAGGAAVSTWSAAGSGSKATSSAVSWTNMPSTTTPGMEEWTSDATPKRTFWAPWSGGSITIGAGNTFTIASAGLTNALA